MPVHAIWNHRTIASTDEFKIVEGKYYFPPHSVITEYLQKNGNQYVSRWKGTGDFYDIIVGNQILKDGALIYTNPDEEVSGIKDYITFSENIVVEKTTYGLKERNSQ